MAGKYDLSEFDAPLKNEEQGYDLSEFDLPTPKQERSALQDIASIIKGGVAGTAGIIPDIATAPFNVANAINTQRGKFLPSDLEPEELEALMRSQNPNLQPGEMAPLESFMVQPQDVGIPSATEGISHGIDTLTGGYTKTPEKGFVKHATKAAEFATPMGLIGKGAKAVEKVAPEVAKILSTLGTTTAPELAGTAGAGAAMSKAQEEGLGPLGSIVAGIGVGGLSGAGLKGLIGAAKAIKEPKTTIGKLLSLGAVPNSEKRKMAQELGWKQTFNDQLDSDLAHGAANTLFDTAPTSKVYRNDLAEAKQSHIDAVVKQIDAVSPDKKDWKDASYDYAKQAAVEDTRNEAMADAFYKRADSKRKKGNTGKVEPIISEMNKIKRIISKSPVLSDDEKWVLNKLNETESKLGLGGVNEGTDQFKHLKGTPAYRKMKLHNTLSNMKKSHKPITELPLEKLTALKSSLQKMIHYNSDIPFGAKRFMGQLIGGVDRAIATTKNQDFLNHQRAANSFFKRQIVDNVRSDIARSIKQEKLPVQAYDFMSDPQKIAELEKIAGPTPAGKQVMNALKRAKLQEVVVDHVTNADGSLSYANLARLFTNKSKSAPMLKALLGKEGYENLEKLATLAQDRSAASKILAGLSKTAQRGHDIAMYGTLLHGALTLNLPVLASVAAEAGSVNLLSRLVSNKDYIRAALKHAEARNANRLTEAGKFKREMGQIFLKQIYPSIKEGASHTPKKEESSIE